MIIHDYLLPSRPDGPYQQTQLSDGIWPLASVVVKWGRKAKASTDYKHNKKCHETTTFLDIISWEKFGLGVS